MYYVYFLKLSNDNIYVGMTDNINTRIDAHNSAKVQSTKSFLPAKLISYIAVKTRSHAVRLEKYFKSGSGKAVAMKRLID